MHGTSRRQFLTKTATGSAIAAFFSAAAAQSSGDPLGMPIGCQTYRVRKMIASDFPGALKVLADSGFQTIELCSPKGYAKAGFRPIGKYKGPELRRLLSDHGLQCKSSHFSMKELRENLDESIAWAKDVGLTQMIVPSLDGPQHPTMDDVKKAAEEYNKISAQSARAGIQQGLHNETFEISTVNGKRTYDVLFDLLDPKLVKFQFQVSTIADGFDPVEYFIKYPGRFISMHVQGWSAKTRTEVPVGQGTLNWKKIFAAAKIGGIKNYFVEMDLPLMQASVPYLRKLKV